MARLLRDSIELAASPGAQQRRAEKNEGRQRDIELMRGGTVKPNATSQRRFCRSLGAQQHLGRGRVVRSPGQRWPSPSEHFAQPSHDPSSTKREPGLFKKKAGMGCPLRQGRRNRQTRPGVD